MTNKSIVQNQKPTMLELAGIEPRADEVDMRVFREIDLCPVCRTEYKAKHTTQCVTCADE